MRTAALVDRNQSEATRALHAPARVRSASRALVVDDADSLRNWRRQLRLIGRIPEPEPVLFQFSQLTPEQNLSATNLAREYQQACGCASGSVFMSVATVGAIAMFLAVGGDILALRGSHVLALAGIAALSAVSGKLLGLVWARWQLVRIADDLSRITNAIDQPLRP